MLIVGLDVSTHCGYAVCEGDVGQLLTIIEKGTVHLGKSILEFGAYPFCYPNATNEMARLILEKLAMYTPDVVVIEETNSGRNRWTQKTLEQIHRSLLDRLPHFWPAAQVVYLDSSEWRSNLGLKMTAQQKKDNAKLRKAMRAAKERGSKVDKKKLGVKGLVSPKHVALNYVNEKFGLKLLVKDNDTADAICLAAAYLNGARPSLGI